MKRNSILLSAILLVYFTFQFSLFAITDDYFYYKSEYYEQSLQREQELKVKQETFKREALNNEFVKEAFYGINSIARLRQKIVRDDLVCGNPANEEGRIRTMQRYAYYVQNEQLLDDYKLILKQLCIMTSNNISFNEKFAHSLGVKLTNYDTKERTYNEAEAEYEYLFSEIVKIIGAMKVYYGWPSI